MFGTQSAPEPHNRAYGEQASPAGERVVRTGPQLPLEARIETSLLGTTVRLPVRAEQVTIEKWPMVVEEVVVHTTQVEEEERLTDTVRREELRMDTEGHLVTQPGEPSRY
jgi:stress response protein YsnF